MRKSVAILLLVVYIIASSGVAIRAHYCCGHLKSINLVLDGSSSEKSAPSTKTMMSKDCCKDKVATNTISDDQKPSTSVISDNSFKDVLNCVSIVSHGFFEAYDDADTTSTAYISPPSSSRDICIAIRVLRV